MLNVQERFIHKSSHHKLILENDLILILLWSVFINTTLDFEEGQNVFIDQQCAYTNCFVTLNKDYQNGDIDIFDAIVFNVTTMANWHLRNLPKKRADHQKYIFHSIQSSSSYVICPTYTDDFFNLTWTYKLDSDIPSPLFEVKDLDGRVVAPKIVKPKWETTMSNLTEYERTNLRRKKKAMIWIVDRCDDGSLHYAKRLQSAFRKNFLDFDIFGCGMFECPENICYRVIKQSYYFYFVPEYSGATDYVSRDVLTAYNNYAVPVVIGNADYKRFLPDRSYINIKTMSHDAIIALLKYTINNPAVYQSFHRWRNLYTITERNVEKGLCHLCAKLNEGKGSYAKRNFRRWWYPGSLRDRCLPGGAETYREGLAYLNDTKPIHK
ncbi:unnamed protein product [Leptosia nina]|uniref:Fucosyltransferase n=1 Tax=Leptosia nina TaxID=320188 RepID=A0AAV1J2V5_9NEOP